ncbi:MAG: hypothetical protein D6746_05690, partial [Bacteroidetes bacterium]
MLPRQGGLPVRRGGRDRGGRRCTQQRQRLFDLPGLGPAEGFHQGGGRRPVAPRGQPVGLPGGRHAGGQDANDPGVGRKGIPKDHQRPRL